MPEKGTTKRFWTLSKRLPENFKYPKKGLMLESLVMTMKQRYRDTQSF